LLSPVHRAALAAGVFALVPCGLAQATTYTVDMGTPPASGKAFQNLNADVNAFFPSAITVHKGDKIRFAPTGFHTVDFPKKGDIPLPLATPSGKTIANDLDPAGNPYWFNGQPDLEFPAALLPPNLKYGKTVTFSGKASVLSGLPLGNKLKPMTVRFTKAGTFTYYCNIHPGMKAKVHVVSAKAKAPSVKSVSKAVKKQASAALRTAKALQNPTVAGNTVQVGNGGRGGVEIYSFFPAKKTVPVGTTLTFAMSPKTLDVHTATTGPGDPENDPSSFLGKLSGSITGQPPFDQAGVYPSDSPTSAPASLTPTLHGNGFWGTGIMDHSAATPLPASGQVTVGAAGTYTFYCLIHPFMKAVVTAS
jgi:plastocyanin